MTTRTASPRQRKTEVCHPDHRSRLRESIAAKCLQARTIDVEAKLAVAQRDLAQDLVPFDVVSAYEPVPVDAFRFSIPRTPHDGTR